MYLVNSIMKSQYMKYIKDIFITPLCEESTGQQ